MKSMRKIAKFLSSVLAAAMLLGMCSFSSSAASFKDVSAKDEALYQAVTLLNSLGIAKGTSDTTYGTSKKVTREQMAAFIYRLMKEGKSVEGGDNMTSFTDLKDSTFYYMISWASENGIIKGRSDTVFDPSGNIILQDCYVMLVRALGYEKDETLSYPYGFIDVAERIGLDENLSSKLSYDSVLTRGDVAIILYNAFYAEMNETYKKTVVPAFERPGDTVASNYTYEWVNDTVCHKIYGVEEIYRRVVATPSYSIDLSALSSYGSEYKAYEPLGGEKADKELIRTAAIVPKQDTTRLSKEKAVIEFADLGLSGKADDYFLLDIIMYVKNDGTILGTSAKGKSASDVRPSIELRSGDDKERDYYTYNNRTSYEKLRSGLVTFGTDKAYFYNLPSSVPNSTLIMYPSSGDEGRMTFKAGYNWCGDKIEYRYSDAKLTKAEACALDKENHRAMKRALSVANLGEGKYTTRYYDSNADGNVDYVWILPYTWGKIVNKTGDSNLTTTKHTGNSAYRAYYNGSKKIPEIYVGGATVDGKYKDGEYVFAYVNGPANYVRIAPDDVNSSVSIMTSRCIRHDSDKNMTAWENGRTIYAWDSGRIIVGHLANTTAPTGLVSMDSDRNNDEAFANGWRSQVKLDSTWELYTCGNRVMMANRKQDTADVAKQYAVLQYVNEGEKQVVFRAGGIQTDGTLQSDEYVHAYVDGKYQIVKQAKNNKDGVRQDDNYYVDNGLVETISTYTVNSNGEYQFAKLDLTAKASDLAGEDASATYGVEVSNVSLDKFQNKIYRFVPNGASTLPSSLSPNGMKYVAINEETKIVVRYVNKDDESDYVIYDASKLPDFNAKDESMKFTKAVVVLKNRTDTTTTEYLAFMYCEIGGDVVSDSKNDNYRLLLDSIQTVDENNRVVYRYDTVDPMTGTTYDSVETTKSSSSALDKFALYKIDGDNKIVNTNSGHKADLASGSADILTLASYETDAKLLFVEGAEDPIQIKDETVFALLDRDESNYTIEDVDMLSIEADDDTDNKYYTPGETKLKLYMLTDKNSGEDFRYAKLVIVVRGK